MSSNVSNRVGIGPSGAGALMILVAACATQNPGPQSPAWRPAPRPCQTAVNVRPGRATLVLTGASVPSLAVRPITTDWNPAPRREGLRAAAHDPRLTDDQRARYAAALETYLAMERLEPAPDAPPTPQPAHFALTSGSMYALVDVQGVVRWRFRFEGGDQLRVFSEPPAEQPPPRQYGHGPQEPFVATARLDGGLTATLSIEPEVAIAECH